MGSRDFEYDAIVIGSGAGGACAAYEMAVAGMKVLMLEKGPARELADFRAGGVFAPGFNSAGRGDELKYIQSAYLMPDLRQEVRFLTYSEPRDTLPPKSMKTSDGWMSQLVGGGTVHYGGASFRFEQADFEMNSTYGEKCTELEPLLGDEHRADLRDWPLSANEMAIWYKHAEKLIGIAGVPDGMPALPYSKAGRLLDEALKKASYEVQLIPTPMAINSQSHMGRIPCQNSGLCQDYACRFEAKSDMRVTLLRRALETGNLRIQPKTFVRKVQTAKGRVIGVECVAGRDGIGFDEIVLPASLVIVACETIETNRLLMASSIGTPDIIGRYLMFHMTGGARAIAPEKTTTWDTAPHTAFTMGIYNHYDHSKQSPFLKTGILMVSSNNGPLADIVRKRYWGEEAKLYFNNIYPYKFDLSYIGDCMPTRYNRVELRRDQVDQFGMPGTEIFYRPHPFDMNASEYAAVRAKEILRIAGGVTEDNAPDHLKPFLRKKPTAKQLYHCTGGARMGEDARMSVVSPDCEVHSVSNLFVVDGSVFPTGAGLNPTLTIQANALRVGDLIAKRASKAGA